MEIKQLEFWTWEELQLPEEPETEFEEGSGFIDDLPIETLDQIEKEEDFIYEEEYFVGIEEGDLLPIIRLKEIPSLLWLAKEIKIHPNDLTKVLESIRSGRSFYKVVYVPKPNGSKREICIPDELLKKIQRRINKHILSYCFKQSPNVYGFSGGSIIEAIKPHLQSKTVLCVDFKDAFPTITFDHILEYFTTGRNVGRSGFHYEIVKIEHGWFSWYAARMLAELTTHKGKLPQGAPTSPRIFDLMCEEIDKSLTKLAKNVEGTYTRYADNIFFSVSQEEFPRPIRQAILKLIEGRKYDLHMGHEAKHVRHSGPNFDWHKLRVKKMDITPQRMLGLNIIDKKIHNTRAFKRRLRLAIHHVSWLLNNGMKDTIEMEIAWKRLKGQMSFSRIDTLPQKIIDDYLEVEKRLT